jgi:hypothetical protein
MNIHSNIIGPLIGRLRRQFRIRYFVETGTCHGDTAELAALMFDKVFTCEIDPDLVAEATTRLAPYPHVQVHQMESPAFLREIRDQLGWPTMYWLDGHWCGGPVRPSRECPLLDELAAIGSLRGHSVILIDDFNYMTKPPPPPHDPAQWPTAEQIREALAKWGERLTYRMEQGPQSQVMVITPEFP